MLPIDRVAEFIRQGKAQAIGQWARDNGIKNVEQLIDAASEQVRKERYGRDIK